MELQLHTDPFSPYFSGFQNSVRKFFARTVLAKADNVRVVSESVAQKLKIENSKLKIYILPIYVDRERIENAKLSFDVHARYGWHFILLAVSRLTEEKNLPLAIEALALVRKQFPDAGLLVVGSGPEEGRLKDLVKKLNLEGHVEFVGWQEDLASFYKTSNLFIQCSFFEGYGLALVEAGLSGLPVVTTPVGVAAELEDGRDARILPIGRVDLFAEAIIDLIEHNDKRENLRFNLKKTLESKLLSKEQYLNTLKENWEVLSKKIY
ncbi:MAG: Capsular polysaccharide biosynthsis protein [Candidatus Gottesmanbacteria bacterium GW2011_GWB1_43_11]|uniref:Capsular polysaccharide biosynthsis protein n=1 Tax=Candidatus Gottesmanbacteria bacterium GW2011_GWB1_43_11 TaxID=1618446 RepID=A0A0G1CES4_9BACT|nr:MAG: Capsular polysaccharide biosynthsis protein [Candidatus Gottesmanbacteria bacterium GW2011_GWB1_43_11]